MNQVFIGRKNELNQLKILLEKKSSSLVVIKGRRRIGKSRLIEEFGLQANLKMFMFQGLAPNEKTTIVDQLKEFGWQLGKATSQPAFFENDWNNLFLRLANVTRKGKVLILFDEISWMGSKDSLFLGKLKNAWDLEFKKNPNLILILCGSVSWWIEKNILNNTGFLGRISLQMTLKELPLNDCAQFWSKELKVSNFEKLKILSVTGGVPKYLEEIVSKLSAEENIRRLCFNVSGLLFNEFDQIFSDIFGHRSNIYKKILECLISGKKNLENIFEDLDIKKNGVIIQYLDDLIKSGFIERDYTWKLSSVKKSKLSHYRISDNYLRFYLNNIEPYKDRISRGDFENTINSMLNSWSAIMGLQFENLVLSNRHLIKESIGIDSSELLYDNPFFQNSTKLQKGCQVDYLIQTKFNTLYVCEIKFSKNPISSSVILEISEKISRLKLPKHFTCRPILIHANGVTANCETSEFFAKIIDFSQFLSI